jgi:hypothetical protein
MTEPDIPPGLEDTLARLQVDTRRGLHQLRVLIGLVALASALGAGVLWTIIGDTTATKKDVNAQLSDLACMVLHYLPPGTSFYDDLAALYPHCPPYVAPASPAAVTLTATVTRSPSPGSTLTLTTAATPATVVRTIQLPGPGPGPGRVTVTLAPSRVVIAGPTSTLTRVVTAPPVTTHQTATVTRVLTVTVTAGNTGSKGKGQKCPKPPCKKP